MKKMKAKHNEKTVSYVYHYRENRVSIISLSEQRSVCGFSTQISQDLFLHFSVRMAGVWKKGDSA